MSTLNVNTIQETTSANGVSIDGVTIKDGQVPASAGSSLVLLKSGTPSGANTGTTFDDFYSSEYDVYLSIGSGLRASVDGTTISIQFYNSSGSAITSSDYKYSTRMISSAGTVWDWQSATASSISPGAIGNADGESYSFALWWYSFNNALAFPYCSGTLCFQYTDANILQGSLAGTNTNNVATAMRGLKFATSTGVFRGTGTIQIYGLKK